MGILGTVRAGRLPSLWPALAAFSLYGGWALYANREAGMALAAASASLQGAMSFVVTLLLMLFVGMTHRRVDSRWYRIVLAALLPVTVVIALMCLGHLAIGTPRVLATVAPSAVIGTLFCLAEAIRLERRYDTSRRNPSLITP